MTVFAVWQPMLPTDVSAPGTGVLRRLSDGRVRQYYDPDHRMARQLAADARAPQPAPDCCTRRQILWDLMAVYPPGARWADRLPPAVVFNGPVLNVIGALEQVLGASSRQ